MAHKTVTYTFRIDLQKMAKFEDFVKQNGLAKSEVLRALVNLLLGGDITLEQLPAASGRTIGGPAPDPKVKERRGEILRYIHEGKTQSEISRITGYSLGTVNNDKRFLKAKENNNAPT